MSLRGRLKSMKKTPGEIALKAVLKRENYERLNRKELKQYARTVGVNTADYKMYTTKSRMLTDINKAWEKAGLEAERGNPAMQDRILLNVEKAKRGELYSEEKAAEKETASSKRKKISALASGGGGGSGGDDLPSELIKYFVYILIALVFLSLLFSIF